MLETKATFQGACWLRFALNCVSNIHNEAQTCLAVQMSFVKVILLASLFNILDSLTSADQGILSSVMCNLRDAVIGLQKDT